MLDLLNIDIYRFIRPLVIISGYLLLRSHIQKYLSMREFRNKFKKDEQEISKRSVDRLVEIPEEDSCAKVSAFGWGEKTRERVRKQERMLQDRIDQLNKNQGNSEDDDDIESLLE